MMRNLLKAGGGAEIDGNELRHPALGHGDAVDADAAEKRLRETMIEISGRLRAVCDRTFASESGCLVSRAEKGQVAP